MRIALAPAVVVVLLGIGCAGSNDPMEPQLTLEATELVKGGGDQQSWYFNNPLPAPYRVTAQDANGEPVSGVLVTWSVVSGAGTVDPQQVATDADGVASATHTLGPAEASQSVMASVPGLPPADFMATAMSPPPSGSVTVGDNFFAPQGLIVRVGGPVTWTWSPGETFHNVTHTNGPTPRPESSPTQDVGMHANAFATTGTYVYVCTIHAGMEGTVTVVE